MPLSFFDFFRQLGDNPALLVTTLLLVGVLLVNGWTDAPNAISAAVVTGALPFRGAVGPGGGVQLSGGAVRHGGERLGGRDHLLHRPVWRGAGGRPHRPVRRHGRHRPMGGAGLGPGHPHQREPRLGRRDLRGGGGSGGEPELRQLGGWAEDPPGSVLSALAGFWAGQLVQSALDGVKAARPYLPSGPAPRSRRNCLSPRGPGRAEVSGGLSPVLRPGPGGRRGEHGGRAGVAHGLLRRTHGPGHPSGGQADHRHRGPGHGGHRPQGGAGGGRGHHGLLAPVHPAGTARVHHPHPGRRPAGGGPGRGLRPRWGVAGKVAAVWLLTFPACLAIGYWTARLFLAWR